MKSTKLILLALVALATVACGSRERNPVVPPIDTLPEDTTTPPPPPEVVATIMAAGNIAECTPSDIDARTAALIDADTTAIAIALGDNAFPNGTAANYTDCYGPSWGRFKARTYAALGNHEYDSSATAEGAVSFFGERAGPPGKGYYSFDAGTWHVVVLNLTDNTRVPYGAASEQLAWLAADLEANASRKCVMAVWHDARFVSSDTAGFNERTTQRVVWERLYAAGVDVILNGGMHMYERMAPMNAAGAVDTVRGIRQFNSGLGGESRYTAERAFIHPNSVVRGFDFGVLKLTLRPTSYDWQFLPIAGATFTDSGTGSCN
jgi:hypothetical protein